MKKGGSYEKAAEAFFYKNFAQVSGKTGEGASEASEAYEAVWCGLCCDGSLSSSFPVSVRKLA